ncbi:2-oxo-4-hydroxy-4-carboxy-5-ureidoimidazoline decarboxylase [soil metagenome]
MGHLADMAAHPVPVEAINRMDAGDFVTAFGDIAEHSPWVAERAAKRRHFADRRAMAEAFLDAVLDAADAEKLALVRAHPDLAGRVKLSELAPESRHEQAGAGLDTLTPKELAQFTALNDAYKEKFGFPFILAVKGADKHLILKTFAERIEHDPEAELATAITQIGRIINFRIEDRVR